MIIIDMNQISVASLMMHLHMNKGELEEDMVRHMILNSVRMYRTMFNEDYGEIVLAYDSRAYWRKEIFPQYKSNRRKNREEDDKDWDSIFDVLNNIKEHVLKGDKSDGVPNVLSPDHTFTDELRQRPLTSKKLESILAQDIDELDDEIKRNYQRNNKLINLDNVPEELEEKILDDFNVATCGDRSKLLNYFIDKRLKSLTEQIGDF